MSDAVARARELLAKATPGPWWLLNEYAEPWEEGGEWHVYGRVGNRIPRVVDNSEDQLTWADAELIAAAPTLLAELAAEVDRLQAALHLRDTTPEPPENAAWRWSLVSNSDYAKVCAENARLLARLDAVMAIHGDRNGDCAECEMSTGQGVDWPCYTYNAALGVES